jgi:hypothetical protein
MSRRTNERNTRTPFSFFEEDEAAPGKPVTPGTARVGPRKVTAPIPGVKRTPDEFKKPATRPTVSHSTRPATGTKREKLAHIKQYKNLMNTHFKETNRILDEHTSWPRYATFERIEEYIQKVKTDYVTPVWEESGNHKSKVEKIHKTQIDAATWDFKSIHKRISTFAEENDVTNRLTLSEPVGNESHKPYANVVLAWLFAAKKQLMYTLTIYLKKHKEGDKQAMKFIENSEAGAAARTKFKEWKAKLSHRAPREPFFADHAQLEDQYRDLHVHRAPTAKKHGD